MTLKSYWDAASYETKLLYARVAVIGALSPGLAWIAARAYQPNTLLWESLRDLGQAIAPSSAVAIEFISTLLLGLYIGLLSLFTVDERKRLQGSILIVGSTIGIIALSVFGVLLPNISFIDPFNLSALLVGLTIPALLEAKQLHKVVSDTSAGGNEYTFPRAATGVFLMLCIICLTCFTQTVLIGNSIPLLDIPVTTATIYILFGFVQYSSQSDLAVIGPRESGKSLLLLGLYLSYRDRGLAGGTEGYMAELIAQADEITPGDDFPIANTYELENLSFGISLGGKFPHRIQLSATDHTGELLSKLGENLREAYSIRDRFEIVKIQARKYNPLITFNPSGNQNYLLFENQVRTADVVLLLIDVQRLQNNDIEYIQHLRTVGQRAQANGSKVFLVATKCDLLINEFSSVADNPFGQGLETEFRRDIEHTLKNGYTTVSELCDSLGTDDIYPVYYETIRTDRNYKPKLDDHGQLQYQGMDTLGKALTDELR